VLDDALRRFAGIAAPDTTIAPAGSAAGVHGDADAAEDADGLHWRTRVSLHVDDEGRIGPFAARSHRVIETADLPLATEAIAEVARGLEGSGRDVDLVEPSEGGVRVIVRPSSPRAPRAATSPDRRGAGRRRGGGTPASPRAPEDPTAREVVTERVGARRFAVDAGGFWQVHRLAASTLSAAVRTALDAAGGVDPAAAHLDLYGGVGLFAATIAELGGPGTRVTSVEADARATEHAGANLAEWVGARAETARTDRFLARLVAQASAAERARLAHGVVLLDPPRARRAGGRRTGRRADPGIRRLRRVRPGRPRARPRDVPRARLRGRAHRRLRPLPALAPRGGRRRAARDRRRRSLGSGVSSVALIDDHESVRLGLEAACARAGVGVVVHSGASVRAYLSWRRAVGAPPADVVVLDLTLGDGTTVTENVDALVGEGSPVLIHSVADRPAAVREALAAGAAGVISKASRTDDVIAAIRTIASGSRSRTSSGRTRSTATARSPTRSWPTVSARCCACTPPDCR
jgi:DNA-binding NarL/FixJ family response regulator